MSGTAPVRGAHRADAGADASTDVAVSIVVVAGLAFIHLLQAYSVQSLPSTVFRHVKAVAGTQAGDLAVAVLPFVALAVVVALYALRVLRGLLAATVVLGMGVLIYLRDLLGRHLLAGGHAHAQSLLADWTLWIFTALVPLAAALGWGIARRRGLRWWPGLAPALLAVAFRWLGLGDLGGSTATHALALAAVLHVVPAVLAGLLCWALDLRNPPR